MTVTPAQIPLLLALVVCGGSMTHGTVRALTDLRVMKGLEAKQLVTHTVYHDDDDGTFSHWAYRITPRGAASLLAALADGGPAEIVRGQLLQAAAHVDADAVRAAMGSAAMAAQMRATPATPTPDATFDAPEDHR